MPFPDATTIAVQRQLQAMAESSFDIGVGLEQGDRGEFIQQTMTLEDLPKMIPFLKARNVENCNIYVRPAGLSGLVLLDDLKHEDFKRLERAGYRPSVWVETSPKNFQAWVRVSKRPVKPSLLTAVAKSLAQRFGADPNSADYRHYGRLAGFTNRKKKYKRHGLFPFVLIHVSHDVVAPGGAALLSSLHVNEAPDSTAPTRLSIATPAADKTHADAAVYRRFANRILMANADKPWASNPDWSRMDWMIGHDMMHAGFTEAAVCAAIFQGSPNLIERHAGPKRMDNYVRHTVNKIFTGKVNSGDGDLRKS